MWACPNAPPQKKTAAIVFNYLDYIVPLSSTRFMIVIEYIYSRYCH